jgi:hypothetical protein
MIAGQCIEGNECELVARGRTLTLDAGRNSTVRVIDHPGVSFLKIHKLGLDQKPAYVLSVDLVEIVEAHVPP